MEHYYSADPTVKSEERIIEYKIKNKSFSFISDNGVFSKNHVDPATDLLLRTIYDDVKGDVLDMGTGYGVIGIVLATNENVRNITMIDVNHRALALAKKNVLKSLKIDTEKSTKINIIESNGFENINSKFDCIITNPPIRAGKAVIYKMYEDAKEHLNANGALYIVINKKHGAPSTKEFLNSLFENCEVMDKKSGFNVIKCIKK